MVRQRIQKTEALGEVARQSEEYQAKFTAVNEKKHALRVGMSDIEKRLR